VVAKVFYVIFRMLWVVSKLLLCIFLRVFFNVGLSVSNVFRMLLGYLVVVSKVCVSVFKCCYSIQLF